MITIRIDINKKYCVTSDSDQMIVNEKGTVKKEDSANFGKESLKPIGYFGTLEQCYRFVLQRSIRESTATSFKELVDDIARIEAELKESIKC